MGYKYLNTFSLRPCYHNGIPPPVQAAGVQHGVRSFVVSERWIDTYSPPDIRDLHCHIMFAWDMTCRLSYLDREYKSYISRKV